MSKTKARTGIMVREHLDKEFTRLGVLFTWLEVAEILEMHEQSIRRHLSKGTMKKSPNVFAHNAIRREDVIDFLKRKNALTAYYTVRLDDAYYEHLSRLEILYGKSKAK